MNEIAGAEKNLTFVFLLQKNGIRTLDERQLVTGMAAGLVLDETEIQSLLPFLRTELFEPYRDREDMHDEVGYLDESWRMFTGISDSHVPMIRLPMNVIHDLAHRWPTELLYEQIVRVIRARNDRRFRKIAL